MPFPVGFPPNAPVAMPPQFPMGGPPPGVSGQMPAFVAEMLAASGSGGMPAGPPPGVLFGQARVEKQLTKRSKQLLGLSNTFQTVSDPVEAAKIVKYQRSSF